MTESETRKRRGRPHKAEEERHSGRLGVRLSADERRMLDLLSEESNLGRADIIRLGIKQLYFGHFLKDQNSE